MTDLNLLMGQLRDSSEEGSLLVIDGDAIAYMIGWFHRDHDDEELVKKAVDSWIREFFLLTSAARYIGVLSAPSGSTMIREQMYKFKKYKGNRKEKEDWIQKWEPIINGHLISAYGFIRVIDTWETDDYVALASSYLTENNVPHKICSPDKDLKQIPGAHIDYRKTNAEQTGVLEIVVSREEANYNWCMQLLMGDATDNVAGLPGIGEKKAKDMLKDVDPMMWRNTVRLAYDKYFGEYYGKIIYKETVAAITILTIDVDEPVEEEIELLFSNIQSVPI